MIKKLFIICIAIALSLGGFFVFSGFDKADQIFSFRFDGRWMPSVNPFSVGAKNYVTLKNLRYEDQGLETVDGYSEINSTQIDTPVSGFHFYKEGESHVVAKVNNSGSYYLYENTTAIPGTGDFSVSSLYQVSDAEGYFTDGPAGTMFYVDDQNALVWGGDEIRAAVVFTSEDSDGDDAIDYSSELSNEIESEALEVDNLFSSVVLLLHMEGVDEASTFTDSSGSSHTISANGGVNTSSDFVKFGTTSAEFDGLGSVGNSSLSSADSADWNMGSSNFAIDLWFRNWPALFPTGGDKVALYEQYDDSDNYYGIYLTVGTNTTISFEVVSSGTEHVSISHETTTTGWKHIAATRSGNTFTLYLNGTSVGTDTYAGALPDLSSIITIGYGSETASYMDGYIDELRITKGSSRWAGNFSVPTTPDQEAAQTYFFIGSPLRINSFTPYFSSTNIASSSLTVSELSGSVWSDLTVTDGTTNGGVSFAQNGTVSWDLSNYAKQRYINGSVLYWYRVLLSSGTAGIYKLNVGIPIQPIGDVWNGSERKCTKFMVLMDTVYKDYTFFVESVDSTKNSVYAAEIGGLDDAGDAIFMMFDEKIMGINVTMTSENVNSATVQIASIKYWNGTEYVSVGEFYDGTYDDDDDSTFAKSGVISWSPPEYRAEQPIEIFGVRGYIYKITINGTLTSDGNPDETTIDYVGGITSPKNITGYDSVASYGGRVLLIDGNRIDYSQTDTPWVFNGIDSSRDGKLSIYIGDDKKITAIGTLHNRYGSNIIQSLAVCKPNETFLLSGSQPYISYNDYFVKKKVSSNIGCPAPMTMRETNLTVGEDGGILRNALMWLDSAGPVIFEGTVPVHRKEGIENYFDPSESECVNYSYIYKSTAYVDTINNEYNLLFPSGDSTVNNAWLVYNYKIGKWYEKVPAAYPVSTFPVRDANGGVYNYGLLNDGTMVRLDNGTTWDGTAIAQQVRTGEFSPPFIDEMGIWGVSHISKVKIVSESITEDRDITISAYPNGSVSAKTITVPLNSGGNISRNSREDTSSGGTYIPLDGYTHQIDFSATTSSEKWNLLYWGFQGHAIRED
jgi:hypothetical protein